MQAEPGKNNANQGDGFANRQAHVSSDFAQASLALRSKDSQIAERIVVDFNVAEIVDFRDKSDFEICEQLSKSYCSNVLTEDQLRSTTAQLGYEFRHSPKYFQQILKLPGSQLLGIVDSRTKVVQGGAIYSICSGLPDEFLSRATDISNKLKLDKPFDQYKIGFTRTAWIDPEARKDHFYTPLTARMMQEMFDVHKCDFILAYYRESPAENKAIIAHGKVGWLRLGITLDVILNPEKNPYKPLVDPVFDNSKREQILSEMGGLKRGILFYSRKVWEERGKAMLNAPHDFDCQDPSRILWH